MRHLLKPSLALLATVAVAGLAQTALAGPREDATLAAGKTTYNTFCSTCHGEKGDGNGPAGAALNPKPRDFTKGEFLYGGTDEDIFSVITEGAQSKGGSPLMVAWGASIPEKDRWSLVLYIRSLKAK